MRAFDSKRTRFMSAIKRLPGLIAYYPMNEISGSSVNYSPTNLNTNNGVVSNGSYLQSGLLGKAYSFNGTSTKVTLNEIEFTATTKISIVALIKPTNITGFQTVLNKRTGTTVTFSFRYGLTSGDGKVGWLWSAGGSNQGYSAAAVPPVITAGVWQLVGVTFDWATPDSCNYYINGAKTVTARDSGIGTVSDDANVPLVIGSRNDDQFFFSGVMQHVAIFNSVLSDGQMYKLAQIAGFA